MAFGLFRLLISGEGVRLNRHGAAPLDVDFATTAFVFATSDSDARRRGIKHICKRLKRQAAIGAIVLDDVKVEVEEVKPARNVWRFVRQGGFTFYRRDDTATEDA